MKTLKTLRRIVSWTAILALATPCVLWAREPAPSVEKVLSTLREGNARFVEGKATHPHAAAADRLDTAAHGQHPIATILACSDSRVPPEIVFDEGIGDLFVIRVAGNVCDTDEVGSIEYGVDHLGTPVFVVLGHTGCGAVTAVATGAELHGNIPALVNHIRPAVEKARHAHPELSGEALVPAAVEANIWKSIEDLLHASPATRSKVKSAKVAVVGAIYDLGSGKVKWLGPHPEQARLLRDTSAPAEHHAAHK